MGNDECLSTNDECLRVDANLDRVFLIAASGLSAGVAMRNRLR